MQGIIYPDGSIRCGNCEKKLMKGQKICPACNERITYFIHKDGAYYRPKTIDEKIKARRKRVKPTTIGLIVVVLLVALRIALPFIRVRSTNLNTLFNTSKHTESPMSATTPNTGTILYYEITQIFWGCDKSDSHEKDFKDFLETSGIAYTNLYYTDEGYYSVDLTGYGPMMKDKYDKEIQDIWDKFERYCSTHSFDYVGSFDIQTWYHTVQ
ncbi:MAG: hypothetical protein MJ123_05705 [Lachnospiraceae bacterium]|nr:hypothetical protein [Lachnospiraceae bacterium]